jgi:hypothetical protein
MPVLLFMLVWPRLLLGTTPDGEQTCALDGRFLAGLACTALYAASAKHVLCGVVVVLNCCYTGPKQLTSCGLTAHSVPLCLWHPYAVSTAVPVTAIQPLCLVMICVCFGCDDSCAVLPGHCSCAARSEMQMCLDSGRRVSVLTGV